MIKFNLVIIINFKIYMLEKKLINLTNSVS